MAKQRKFKIEYVEQELAVSEHCFCEIANILLQNGLRYRFDPMGEKIDLTGFKLVVDNEAALNVSQTGVK